MHNIPIILLIAVLAIYIVWKLFNTGNQKKPVQRRFDIRRRRYKGADEDEEEV